MDTIKTDTKYNFTKAENNIFSWSYMDGTSGNILVHKPSGRRIYQMTWLDKNGKMAETVGDDIRKDAILFKDELNILQDAKPQMQAEPELEADTNYCLKCGSYCWGDCEANL